MNPEHDGDFSKTAPADGTRRLLWGRWLAVALVLLFLIAGIAGFALRKSLAERILAGWCSERELSCAGEVEELGLGGATLGNLTVSGKGQRAFEAEKVRVRLNWPGFLTPGIAGVEVDTPVVHGQLADGRLGFHGLERLIPSGGGGGGSMTLPAIEIRDGRILIATSAGEVGASVSASGTFPQDGHLSLTLDPASLDEPQGYLRWSGGEAEFTARNGQIEGRADVTLEEVRTDDVLVSDAALTATVEAGLGEADPAHLVWEGRIAQASGAEFGIEALSTSGEARLGPLSTVSTEAVLAALTEANVQLETGAAHWAGYSAEAARLEASLHGEDGAFSGPAEVSLAGASFPQGRAGQFDAAGQLDWSADTGLQFAGQVSAESAALADDLADHALKVVSLPSPLSAHGNSLQTAFRRALADFGAKANISLRSHEGAFSVGARDVATLQAGSGLSLTLTPQPGQAWLSVNGSNVSANGEVALKGGGAPNLTAAIDSLTAGNDGVRLSAGKVQLSPWTVDGVRFGADVASASVETGAEYLAIKASGTLLLAGPVFGLDLSESHLKGGFEARREAEGLRVEPAGKPCFTFDTGGVGLGGVSFEPATLQLCPKSGAFMKPGNGQAGGTILLGDVSWPFASKSVTGMLGLEDATVDWSMKNGLAFTVSSPTLNLPLDIDERTLIIDSARPRVSISTAKGRVPRLSAVLNDTVLGGTLIPAKVSAGQMTLDGQIGSGGLSGDLAGKSVLIRDFRDDPVYQPLLSDLTARMDEWQLALSGPLRLQESDVPVGDINADINVLNLNGTAHVESRLLEFRKGGLQPVMLSERLRGVYTDAVGQMKAASDVTISGGKLDGTARVSVANFGFQTTRLGRVENVNGEVVFADLFSLSTEPSQVVTVGGMNPGVPLRDGRIVFRFSEGKVLAVDSAAFPFSGGVLALSPFNWTLGADTQHVEVTADAIDLAELVRILNLPKIEAEGTVSGRFPIDVERSSVLIRDARLLADEGGGRVAYLGDAADSAAKSDANVRLAFEALKDFDFTVLEVGLDGNVADRVKITLKLAGKSRNDITYGENANIVRGQPFEFNIAIDSALAELFRSSQFYTNQQKLTDFVVREVLTDKGLKPAEDE